MTAHHNTGGMKRDARAFDRVQAAGVALPGVKASIRYDGMPVLKVNGCFMAGLASHPSAEPGSLVVRMEMEEREWLLADAAETYYVTEYYRRYPIVLARLSHLDAAALRDLLSVSYRLTVAKLSSARRRPGRRTAP